MDISRVATMATPDPVTELAMFVSIMLCGLPGIIVRAREVSAHKLAPSLDDQPEQFVLMMKACMITMDTIVLAVAAVIGVCLTPTVALKAPWFHTALGGKQPGERASRSGSSANIGTAVRPQLLPALCVGLFNALLFTMMGWYQRRALEKHYHSGIKHYQASNGLSLQAHFFMGATDEIIRRWGCMTLFVWLFWQLVNRGEGDVRSEVVWVANILTGLLLGAFHLRATVKLGLQSPLWIVITLAFHTIIGSGCGWLYWRKGLEAAMLANAMMYLFQNTGFDVPVLTIDAARAWRQAQEFSDVISIQP